MKNKIKKASIWILCISLLGFISLLPSAMMAKADSGKVSAYDQLIASAMSQCMDQLYATATDDFNNQWNPFAVLDFASVTVGYDLHNKLYGNTDSGSISCKDFNVNTFKSNIIEAFATSINPSYSTDNIVCNGENPGLMKLQWKDSNGNWKDMTGACASYIDEADGFSYRFVLNDRAAADSYIDSLYAGDWKSVNNFSDEAKYALYLDEYVAACTTGKSVTSNSPDKAVAESSSQVNLSGYGDYILKINSNGNAEYVYYEQGNKATAWIDKSLSGGIAGASDCEDLRNKINEKGSILHEEYENQLVAQIEADKEMCTRKAKGALVAAKQLAKDGYEGYDKTVAELEAMNGEYWTMEGNVVHCKTWSVPDKLVQIETETEKNDPNNPGNISSGADDSSSNLDTVADDADISACKKATSLGWVICPVMNLVGKAAMGLYSQLSGQWLTIDAEEIKIGSPVYNAWKEFRNYANIAFAIVFAIVVFSQVTGIGLSNYSIKKMLPTLIVVAVLVNLSFFICQLAVDVTNIVGVGIGDVLDKIGTTSMMNSQNRTPFETAGYVTAGLFSAAGVVLGGYAAAPIVVTSIGSILIAVLLAGISSLIGYFFLLILMALRKAILYIIIVVAPLAFICYALPNTKSLFDKWKKLFMNLLLVFPICQILVYGGQAMSKIMISSDENSFFFQFTAMLLQIVPIFFIPMVLRSSMSMLGNIGTKVSQMGAKVGHGLSGLAGRTQLASRATVGMNKWGANRLSGWKRMTREPKGRLGRLSQASSKARIASALTKAEELRQSDNKATNITSEGYMDNVAASADIKAKEEAADNYVSGLLTGAVTDADGNAYDMNDIRKEVAGEGVDGDLTKLYAQALAANDETKIKGLSKYLMNIKGGKGMAVIAAAMRKKGGSAFKADGTLRAHDAKERAGFNTAAKYLTSNEKWNMMTKKWDPNMTNLLADGSVDSDDKITDRGTGAWAYYNAGAAGKSTPAQMINHDDSYFDGLKNVYGSEAGAAAIAAQNDAGAELRQSLEAYHGHAQEVFDNPRVYSQAGGALRDIQNVSNASQAYYETMNRLEQEAQASNNKAQFAKLYTQVKKEMEGKYKKLEPRNTFNVPRDNSKSNNNKNGNAYDSDGNNIFE